MGLWEDRPIPKADNLNRVLIPHMEHLLDSDQPFFVMLRHMDPHTQEIKCLSRDYGLELLAIEQPSLESNKMEQAFQAAVDLGIPIVNCGPGGRSGDEASLQQSIESLGELAASAERHGVSLCVKAHVGASIHNTPTTLRAMDAISSPSFGIDMDPSHIYRAGEDPSEALDAVMSRIKHVHIRDCNGRQAGPGKPEEQANGRGGIDLLKFIRVLHEHDYTGPLDLEIIGTRAYRLDQCCAIASESRGHMQASLQACGTR